MAWGGSVACLALEAKRESVQNSCLGKSAFIFFTCNIADPNFIERIFNGATIFHYYSQPVNENK